MFYSKNKRKYQIQSFRVHFQFEKQNCDSTNSKNKNDTLSFVFFEVDNTKDVANTKLKGRFWKKLRGKTTSLVKTIKDHTIPKDDYENETVKDLDTKNDHSKLDGIDSKNAVKPDDVDDDDTTKVIGTDDVGQVDTHVNYLF